MKNFFNHIFNEFRYDLMINLPEICFKYFLYLVTNVPFMFIVSIYSKFFIKKQVDYQNVFF